VNAKQLFFKVIHNAKEENSVKVKESLNWKLWN